jgi:hypothetical protein
MVRGEIVGAMGWRRQRRMRRCCNQGGFWRCAEDQFAFAATRGYPAGATAGCLSLSSSARTPAQT